MNYYTERVKEGIAGEFPISETECYIFFQALVRKIEKTPDNRIFLRMKQSLQEHIVSCHVNDNGFEQWRCKMMVLNPEKSFVEDKIVAYENSLEKFNKKRVN